MKVLNKISAKLIVAVSFVLGSFANVNAQETITVDPISIAPGEEAEVVVNYSSTVERSGYNMEVILPESLSFVTTLNEDDEPEAFTLGSSALSSHMKVEYYVNEKHVKLTILHLKEKNLKDGVLLSFKVKADESFTEPTEITFKGIIFNGGDYLEDFTVPVTKGTPTGINGIEANSEKAASFNLAGQKVSANAKGIRIQNGKKVVVK